MKILYAHSSTSPQGGAELRLLETVVWAKKELDHDVSVLLPDRNGLYEQYVSAGISVRVAPMSRLRKKTLPWGIFSYVLKVINESYRLVRLIKEVQPDLVHVNEVTDLAVILAAVLARVSVVVHARTILTEPIGRIYAHLVYHLADSIPCVSEAVKERMFSQKGVSGDKTFVLRNPGPNYERFYPASVRERQDIRLSLGISDRMLCVGMISKLQPVKGHMHFVRAARAVVDQLPDQDVRFLIVGGDVAGEEEYKAALLSEVAMLGLGQKMRLLNYRSDTDRLLKAMDVFVHPALYEEPFAGVVLEAMASGVPVVAYDSGGTREQFRDGVSGYLVDKGDIEGLAYRVAALLASADTRQKISQAGYHDVREMLSKEKYLRNLTDLYHKVLNQPRSEREVHACNGSVKDE